MRRLAIALWLLAAQLVAASPFRSDMQLAGHQVQRVTVGCVCLVRLLIALNVALRALRKPRCAASAAREPERFLVEALQVRASV